MVRWFAIASWRHGVMTAALACPLEHLDASRVGRLAIRLDRAAAFPGLGDSHTQQESADRSVESHTNVDARERMLNGLERPIPDTLIDRADRGSTTPETSDTIGTTLDSGKPEGTTMTDYDVQDMVTLVTGGASGIGEATSLLLARGGAHVAVADLRLEASQRVVDSITAAGGRAFALEVNVTDETSVDAAVSAVLATAGRLDAAVNSAGVGMEAAPLADTTTEEYRRVVGVNLDGIFFCLRAQIRAMRPTGGGSIVNLASMLAQVATAGASPYVAAKHGVLGLTRTAALDHAADGIRVNAVAPGYIGTPMVMSHTGPERLALLNSLHPVGRLGQAEEVAEMVAWLVSAASTFCTGSIFTVDGGYTAR
ncbi:unannotated protein [freshwater metagenome]|uniref:Unannotated protein n=1 Tax=freshwater metagenome TaxID=449393 RepID=A0A6J7RSM9_9ZZZZ